MDEDSREEAVDLPSEVIGLVVGSQADESLDVDLEQVVGGFVEALDHFYDEHDQVD